MNSRSPSGTGTLMAGISLVEILVSISILGILAVGGTGYMAHSRSLIEQSRNRRVALEAGTARLEALRQALYTSIAPTNQDYSAHYLLPTNGQWLATPSDPGETTLINGKLLPITTTIRFLDVEAGQSDTYDYLQARVEVGYRVNRPERVVLETKISP